MHEGLTVAVTSDSHVGKKYPTLEFREQDINDGFGLVINDIAKENPDILIHGGDLYDTVFPPGWVFELGLDAMRSLPQAARRVSIVEGETGRTSPSNIFIVHGNHDGTPDARCESGSFSVLKYFDTMSLANYLDVRKAGENIFLPKFVVDDGTVRIGVQGLGHRSVSQFENLFAITEPIEGVHHNVLVIHQSIADLTAPYTRGELLQMDLIASKGFDLVVAGHTHRPVDDVLGTTRFIVPGSTERIDSGEFGERKGYYLLTFTPGDIECVFRTVDVDRVRKIRKYDLDVDGLSGTEITDQCVQAVTDPDITDALVHFVLRGQTPHGHVDVDRADIEERLKQRGARAVKVNTERLIRREIGELVSTEDWKAVRITADTFRRLFSERSLRDLSGTPIRDETLISLLAEAAFSMYRAVEREEKEEIPPVLQRDLLSVAESLHAEEGGEDA